jgi:hypothetical protein
MVDSNQRPPPQRGLPESLARCPVGLTALYPPELRLNPPHGAGVHETYMDTAAPVGDEHFICLHAVSLRYTQTRRSALDSISVRIGPFC